MIRAALLASAVLLSVPVHAAQPNIVVIMTDDQEDNLANMPKLKARLKDGTRFVNSFVNFPLCSPSRATFMSGQIQPNHGVREGSPPSRSFVDKGLLPMWLQDAGYTTAIVGVKALNKYYEPAATLGFQHSVVIENVDVARYYDPSINKNGVITERIGEYSTDIFLSESNSFIRGAATPYFLFVPVSAPHAPAIPARRHVGTCGGVPLPRPPSFNEADVSDKPSFVRELPEFDADKEDRLERAYREKCETIRSVDELAADMVDRASSKTCVFFTSDHGFSQGSHRITGKLYAYDEMIRTPLVMWGCGAPKGAEVDALVYNPDVTATLVALSGATPSRKQDGRSLLPLLDGTPQWRTALPIIAAGGGVTSTCARTLEWLYCSHSNGEKELYSMDRDPYQLANKAALPDRLAVAASLHKLAAQLNRCAGQGCWFAADPLQVKRPRK